MAAAALTETQGILALAALAVAILALIACALLTRSVRRLRGAQRLVLGDASERDLVAHSASLQEAFQALQDYVGDSALRLEQRLDDVELALTGAISRQALVRYDAYNELSGQQSVSIALLDALGSGVVLTCIHHRDQARVYAKQVRDGQGELELSPEEGDAVRIALDESPARLRPAAPAMAPTDTADATGR
ncbi:MAG TPA: DUF4446 family protein [Solirubrobacteraceae bacterium]|jgi:hypothetical protein|nr:DUF4446 family protein [Solirubrobacteraceae bacterium]